MQERLTLTVPEVAKLLGISRGTAYLAAKSGEIPVIRIRGRFVVPMRAVDELLKRAMEQTFGKEKDAGG